MEIKDVKRRTDLVTGLVTLIAAVITTIFLITPKAPMILGIAAIVTSSLGIGFGAGAGYSEWLNKKGKKEEPQQNSVE